MTRFASALFLSLALALGMSVAEEHGNDGDADAQNGDMGARDGGAVADVLQDEEGQFDTFLTGLETSALNDTVQQQEVTVIAPRDQAFEATPDGRDAFLDDTQRLTEVTNVHVLEGAFTADELAERSTVRTVEGQQLQVDTTAQGDVTVGGVQIAEADLRADDDVVHVAEDFISPQDVGGDGALDEPENDREGVGDGADDAGAGEDEDFGDDAENGSDEDGMMD